MITLNRRNLLYNYKLGSKFWAMLESNFCAKKALLKTVCIKIME